MELFTSSQMRQLDAYAIKNMGIASTLLMENAAKAVVAAVEEYALNRAVAIFCGSGNNGGDGIAAARYLLYKGYEVKALLVGRREKLSEDAAEMERRLREAGGRLEDFDLRDESLKDGLSSCGAIVDAMLGTGLNSPVRGSFKLAVELINSLDIPVVAADIPSGISSDTGEVLGCAVMADVTVTFAAKKRGHCSQPGNVYSGKIRVADIGIPTDSPISEDDKAYSVESEDIKKCLPAREPISHKGDYGRLLIISGSTGYTGAPYMAAEAAVRSGAGLVFLGVPESIYPIVASKCVESMPFPLPCDAAGRLGEAAVPEILRRLEACDVCLVGPGLGRSEEITHIVSEILKSARVPCVLDADGINAAAENIDVLDMAPRPVIITPHEGEFKRLGGKLSGDRIRSAAAFSAVHGCITVLKGHRSITALPDKSAYVNTTGNPGMAKGGSGDVLAGIIAALICQMPLREAVTAAVYVHGRAGDICARKLGEYSMTPLDMICALPEAFKEILS